MKIEATGTGAVLQEDALRKTVGETLSDAIATQTREPDFLQKLEALASWAHSDQWPMDIQEFKAAGYLEPGDVILMTKVGSLFSTLTRIFDQSKFAHVALVYQTPHYGDGIDKTFLIETTMRGVDLEALSEIVTPSKIHKDTGLPPDFVVGVKRLESDWATLPLRRMAASRMLHFIDADDYNFRLMVALANRRTRQIYLRLRRILRGRAPSVGEFLRTGHRYLPAEFICSGFVQYAYVDMVRTAVERNLIDKSYADQALRDVLFCERVNEHSPMEELMACTPRDLAHSTKLNWKYIIHRGQVFKVSSGEEVDAFFKNDLPRRLKIPA